MKNLLFLLASVAFFSFPALAQDNKEAGRLQVKMAQYIAKKLKLNSSETEKFQPMFLEYHSEVRKSNIANRGDRLKMQQQIVEIRLRYREKFKSVIGEKKSNEVFFYEREFIKEVQELRKQRRGKTKRNMPRLQ